MTMDSTNPTLEIISDVVCPWCYIGKRRLKQALELCGDETPLRVRWKPYQLNPKMPIEGVERQSYYAAKFGSAVSANQLIANITANAHEAGLEIDYARIERVPNTLAAHRLIWFAEHGDTQDAVVEALFRAYFIEGRDLGDHTVLVDIAQEVGLDRARVDAFLSSDVALEHIQGEAKQAHNSGIQGVPAFVFNGRYLFSGAQSPETISLSLKRAIKKGL